MAILHEPSTMPKSAHRPTAASIQAAKDYNRAERIHAGLSPDNPAPITLRPLAVGILESDTYPLHLRVACHDALDPVIEQFGLEMVIRCLRAVAAINRREL